MKQGRINQDIAKINADKEDLQAEIREMERKQEEEEARIREI